MNDWMEMLSKNPPGGFKSAETGNEDPGALRWSPRGGPSIHTSFTLPLSDRHPCIYWSSSDPTRIHLRPPSWEEIKRYLKIFSRILYMGLKGSLLPLLMPWGSQGMDPPSTIGFKPTSSKLNCEAVAAWVAVGNEFGSWVWAGCVDRVNFRRKSWCWKVCFFKVFSSLMCMSLAANSR